MDQPDGGEEAFAGERAFAGGGLQANAFRGDEVEVVGEAGIKSFPFGFSGLRGGL